MGICKMRDNLRVAETRRARAGLEAAIEYFEWLGLAHYNTATDVTGVLQAIWYPARFNIGRGRRRGTQAWCRDLY